uniref:Zinc finger, AN1-type, zinc finger, A20-type n=1 Tax=Tanacetum cinerariifolium TaxID=118510 RepID=A0A699GVJ4_TANCI|nr:zinc finger, AN1-type, zinc finger, A20-type [Tanacetum cinerariifolium]
MPSMKEELDQSTTPPLCKTGCGFYVNKEAGGFCSSCYKVDVIKKKASFEVPKIPDVNNNVNNQKPVENHHQSNEVVKKRNQYHVCSKHVGLVPFLCRCGESFCRLHRMPEKHACKFDFKAAGRMVIEKQNILCVADKLEFRGFHGSSTKRFIDDGICVLDGSPTKWLNLIPIKINILAWRVALNKLPTRFNMSLRGMEVSTMKCPVCRVGNETSDHLFFSCSLVSAMISRPVENHHQSNKVVKKKNRCHARNKCVWLVPFSYRCSGRVILEKQNPLCVAGKLEFRSAYTIISSEESHMIATGSVSGTSQRNMRTDEGSTLFCEDCGFNGHTIDRCFKIIGYPPNFGFLILDGSINHFEIPYDDERSDPSFSRYGTPSSHSGSTFDTHNKNEGWHSLGSDAATSKIDRLLDSKPFYIPMQPNVSLSSEPKDDDPLPDNINDYQKLIGKLIYLTTTRPDIAYTVSCLSQLMHSPLKSHLKTALKVIKYLKGYPGKVLM